MQTQTVSTPRGDFLVQQSGDPDGTPMVLVSGLGDDHAVWNPVLPFLDEYRCITFDNRGIGGSVHSPGPYDVTQLAADGHAVVAQMGLEPYLLVGSSMGGAIAQEWSAAHPDEVLGAVLTNTWAAPDPLLDLLFEHWIGLADGAMIRELAQSATLFSFSPAHLGAHTDQVRTDGEGPDLVGFSAAAAACRGHDSLALLSSIETEVLVVVGTEDVLIRPPLSQHLADALPRATVRSLTTGHMAFVEQPETWSRIVLDWWSTRTSAVVVTRSRRRRPSAPIQQP